MIFKKIFHKIFHIGQRELRNRDVGVPMFGRRRECGASTVEKRVVKVPTEGRRLAWA